MSFLKNVRVAIRLPFVPIAALVALVVFALTAMSTLGSVRIGSDTDRILDQDAEILAAIVVPEANLLAIEHSAMETLIAVLTTDPAALETGLTHIDERASAFRTAHDSYQQDLTDTAEIEAMAAVRNTGLAYLDVLERDLLPAARAFDAAAVLDVESTLEPLFLAHEDAVTQAEETILKHAADNVQASDDLVSSRTAMLWALLGVTLLAVGAAAFVVTRSVLKPLDELRRNMDDIASGDNGNADVRLDADRRDEFGQVAGSFNTFADKLVATTREVEANARVAQDRAQEVSQAANVAAENMNTVAVATTELSSAASEIARSAGDASRTAETAVRAADHANQLMERLADSSARIGEVVESIRGIAAQTTMLALNATIEAARAGEAGRGFAVVASEVKDLAAETGTATADIVGRVDAIQADTQAALVALGEVAQVITEISSSQSVIAAAVEEQAATTAEIDRSLTEAVTAVNQLADQTGHAGSAANSHFTSAA